MKRQLTAVAAAALALGMMAPAAFAATTSSTVNGQKAISVNGKVVSNPFVRVAKDGSTSTSYMGVWYLGQAVKQAGGDYSWDNNTKVFNIVAPGVDASKVAAAIPGGVGTGNTDITVNGVLVKKVNSFAAQDPAGGKSDITTFMPIFYLGEIFSNLGGSSWDGNTFGLKNFVQVGAPAAVKVSVSKSSLVANGADTSTVTFTVVDSNGNTVTNYNGPVSAWVSGGDVTLSGAAAGTGLTAATPASFMAVNGVATVTLDEVAHPVSGDVNAIYGSLSGVSNSQGVAAVTLAAATGEYFDFVGAPKFASVGSDVTFGVEVTDQLHQTLSAQPRDVGSVVVTVSGPATFAGGKTSETIDTATEGGAALTTSNLTLYPTSTTATGTVTVSFSSPNTTLALGPSVSFQYANAGTATQFALTSSAENSTTTFAADTLASTGHNYDIQVEDVNGESTTPSLAPTATVTFDGASTTNLAAQLTPVSNGEYTLNIAKGTTDIAAGTYTVTVNGTGMQPLTIPVTVTAGAAAGLVVSPDSTKVTTLDVTSANPSTTVTAQLVDNQGNPVAQANVPVTFTASDADLTLTGGSFNGTENTVYTNGAGIASVQATVAAAGDNGYVTVAGATATKTTSVIAEPTSSTVTSAGVSATVSYGAGNTSYVPGNAAPTVTFYAQNAAGVPQTGDTLEYTITGPNSYSDQSYIVSTTNGATVTLSGANLPSAAGTYSISVEDLTSPTHPSATATLVTVKGTASAAGLFENGSPVSNPVAVAANTPIQLVVSNVDGGSNVVTSSTATTINLLDKTTLGTGAGGYFSLSQGGAPVTQVTIPANSTGVTVYYVNGTSGNYDLTGMVATTASVATLTSAGLNTQSGAAHSGDVVLTYSGPLVAGTPDASQFKVSVNGANDAVTGASISGDQVILTLAAVPAVGQTVTVSYTPDTTAPVADANGNVAAFSNQLVTLQ